MSLLVCNSIKKRLHRTAIVVAFEVKLAFSKESQTKTDATVSQYIPDLAEQSICCDKNAKVATVGAL